MGLLDWMIKRVNNKRAINAVAKAIVFGGLAVGSVVGLSACAVQEPAAIEDSSIGQTSDDLSSNTNTSEFLGDLIEDSNMESEEQGPYQDIESKIVAMNKKILEPDVDYVQALGVLINLRAELESVKINCLATENNNAIYEALKLNIETLEYDLCVKVFASSFDSTFANEYLKLTYFEQGKENNKTQTTLFDIENSTWVAVAGNEYMRCTKNYLEKCKLNYSDYEDMTANPMQKDIAALYDVINTNIMNVGPEQVSFEKNTFTIHFSEQYFCKFKIDKDGHLLEIVFNESQNVNGKQTAVVITYTFELITQKDYNKAANKIGEFITTAMKYARPENYLPRD